MLPRSTSAAARRARQAAKKRAAARRKQQAAAKLAKRCRTVTKKVRGRRRKVKVCTPVAHRRRRTTTTARPVVAPRPPVVAPAAPPAPSAAPVPVFSKPLTELHAERLLWRAGFGPLPGQAAQVAAGGLGDAVLALTRPVGAAQLHGPEPVDDRGQPLAPADAWGHGHCWWLDRMVRSDQPLVERMTLIWHDWFATSQTDVGDMGLMLAQNRLFRDQGLGRFDDLFTAVTADPAMLVFLNGNANNRWNPNENYAREMMELFSLGADRGAYTETDIRQMARALTGWRSDWSSAEGNHNFRYDATWHDPGTKTVFGQTGAFDWRDAVRLCVEHPLHASFFCTKLWSYFVPVAPDDATLASLMGVYLTGGRQIRPVVEAILQHPAFLDGPEMVIGPTVHTAGLLRAIGRGIDTTAWAWLAGYTGQQLFYPPNVAGWDDTRWLDTSTVRGRWLTVHYVLSRSALAPYATPAYDAAEDAATAVTRAMATLGNPSLTLDTQRVVADFATTCLPATLASWQRAPYRAMRQNALRMLIATSPDRNVC